MAEGISNFAYAIKPRRLVAQILLIKRRAHEDGVAFCFYVCSLWERHFASLAWREKQKGGQMQLAIKAACKSSTMGKINNNNQKSIFVLSSL